MPEDGRDRPRRPRGFWSGTLSFGLVSVPVSLFAATRSGRISLRMVDRDGTPLSRVYFCSREERPLERDDIVRGYELEKNRYVEVEDEELDAIAPGKSEEIALERFVAVNDIDPMYFQRAYYLAPGRGGTRPYRLLARAMEDSDRAGIATFVMRGREYLVAIIAERGLLRAETLRFHDEVRTPETLGLPALAGTRASDVGKLQKAMTGLHADRLDERALEDPHRVHLEELVERKLERGDGVVRAPEAAEPSRRESAEIIDLMQMLKRSVEETEDDGRARTAKTGGRARKTKPGGRTDRKRAAAAPQRGALEGRSKDELYRQAQRLDIPGRSRMSKEELIGAIAGRG